MTTVGLRELRLNASEIVRRVESGEEFTVTVAGRPSARLLPVEGQRWRSWDDVAELFAGPVDQSWEADRERLDGALADPWERP